MKKQPKQKVILNSAYRQVNIIDQNANRIMHSYDGPKQFQNLFPSNHDNQQEEGVQIQKQPLYFDQVDHNIEEVGIMTVKQVRYLTDQEWEEWVKERENLIKLFEPPKTYKYQSRHSLAVNRPRNQMGQFVSKPKQKKAVQKGLKKRKINKKRGRKPRKQRQQTNQK